MKKLVVLTGAGMSEESGISTFRDSNGLWNNHNIDEVATPEGFRKNPQLVLDFYNARRKDILKAQPNAAHIGLAELEEMYDVQIITQNIDDLHERGGSKHVLHLHGEIMKMKSVNAHMSSLNPKLYPCNRDITVGDLAEDGGQLRPHVVWFYEQVPNLNMAKTMVERADILVVIGTSLQVYPASSLIEYVRAGIPIYFINPVKHFEDLAPDVRSRISMIQMKAVEGVDHLTTLLQDL